MVKGALRQNLFDHLAVYIRQSKISTAVPVGETGVIEAQKMQNGGVQVVRVNRIFHGLEAEVVGCPVSDTPFYPAACEQHEEAVAVVVAAVLHVDQAADLDHRCSAELAADEYDGCL